VASIEHWMVLEKCLQKFLRVSADASEKMLLEAERSGAWSFGFYDFEDLESVSLLLLLLLTDIDAFSGLGC
jgi:hypothetical protein